MDLLFYRLSLCLSKDSLSRETGSLDIVKLYFIQIHISIPVIQTSPIFFHQFFHILTLTRNIFLIPNNGVDRSAKARNIIVNFNCNSLRPHSNNILLSNVYSFDAIEFTIKDRNSQLA